MDVLLVVEEATYRPEINEMYRDCIQKPSLKTKPKLNQAQSICVKMSHQDFL